ncbi:MAG: hypothetical protein LBM93_01210 [Oscillospiraceae bacterium]|nr:hypothetical protein [Oscillospiraceae bacterium]
MKYIKIIIFDIKNGILKNKFFFCCVLIMPCIFCIDFLMKAKLHNISDYSFADFYMFIYGGMNEYIPSSQNMFRVPVLWVILFTTMFFGSLNYPYNDLFGYGKQILLRTKGRVLWWLSKCCWNVVYILLFHIIIIYIICIFVLIVRADFELDINVELLARNFLAEPMSLTSDSIRLQFLLFSSPILISVALNLLQMTISLFIKPIFSFLLMSVILISSSYLMSNSMLGNYGMIFRSNIVLKNGLNFEPGIYISLIIIVLSIIIGMFKFKKYDIINTVD